MHYNISTLRRHERSLSEEEARKILHHGLYGILSMQHSSGGGYGIPLHYAWDGGESIFFHAAPEGEKLRCVAQEPNVSFCVVSESRVLPQHFSTAYRSIILQGNISRVEEEETKMQALRLLLQKYTPKEMERGLHYAAQAVDKTCILQLNIRSWSGKHGFEVP